MRSMIVVVTILAVWGVCFGVENADFEEGTEGWKWWFQDEPVAINVIDGDDGKCVQFLGEAGTRVAFYQAQLVEPGTWYRVEFRYMAGPNGEAAGSFGSLATRLVDANGKHFDYPLSMPFLDTFGRWVKAEGTFRAPLSAASVWLEFNSAGACDLRIDDVSMIPVDAPADSRPPNTWSELARRREEPLWFSSWQYNLRPDQYRERGLKYGWRYRHLDQFEQLKETRTLTWTLTDEMYDILREKQIPACIYLHYPAQEHHVRLHGGTLPGDVSYIIDPKWHDAMVAACEEACEKYADSPGIEYIFVEDEAFGKYLKAIIPREKRKSAVWEEIDADVRRRFGGGRFGLPDAPDDPNPYRWIAYYKWAGDQLNRTFQRIRKVIDATECGAKLLGPDEAHILYPLPWCDLAETVDIFTGQSLSFRSTAGMYNTGFLTKASADMTGKPVHNATQIVMYAGSPSAEEVRRRYSQVLQNGGEGEMLIAEEWGDRELSHHQYSAPARWATVKNLLKLMSEYEVQTPADSRVGILFSSPSQMAMGSTMDSDALQAAYALCGPVLGAWPTIIDSYALGKGATTLDGLDILVVPHAPLESAETFGAIESFVRAGGMLVCCDPLAFGHDTMGEALPADRLLGVQSEAIGCQRSMDIRWPRDGRQRAYAQNACALSPAEGARVVGEYANSSAAVTLHELGAGSVLVFGSNPLESPAVVHDAQWVNWWRELLASYGVPMDLPIWNLRLPDEAIVKPTVPSDVCVTGNNFIRCQNGVYLWANDSVDGSYEMSVAPDLSPESGGSGPIPFSKGDLTDRTQADRGPFGSMRIAKDPYREADWANRWSAEALRDGLTIELSLPYERSLTRLRFWYSGSMPPLKVQTGPEETSVNLASADAGDVGEDVEEVELALSGLCSEVRLVFGQGTGQFCLADLELWARGR